MSIEFGFNSPLWMSESIVKNAPPLFVKAAVIDLMDHLWNTDHVCVDEIFDRLVQVSASGKYVAPVNGYHDEDFFVGEGFEPGPLTPEEEEALRKWKEQLEGLPETEEGEE